MGSKNITEKDWPEEASGLWIQVGMRIIPRIFESSIYTQVLTGKARFLFIPVVPLMCLFAAKKAGECIDTENSTMHYMQELRSHDFRVHWIRKE